ncbi:MAG: hypothetical protein SFV54_21740 [Bryobacteraceae bacterium]|nr:hypothetical protein [Bryobacteraceae bacterium]
MPGRQKTDGSGSLRQNFVGAKGAASASGPTATSAFTAPGYGAKAALEERLRAAGVDTGALNLTPVDMTCSFPGLPGQLPYQWTTTYLRADINGRQVLFDANLVERQMQASVEEIEVMLGRRERV